MRKIILMWCIFFLVFLGCENETSFEEHTTVIPAEENKTYLEIKNQSQFDVNIYFNAPSADSLWLKVPTGGTVKKRDKS